jgi:hypothetical protein
MAFCWQGCFALGLLVGACRAVPPEPRVLGREWLSVTGSVADRQGVDEAVVEDAGALGIDGGWDLVVQPVRIGLEAGVVASRHDLELSVPGVADPELQVWRFSMGARAAWDLEALGSAPYVRAGVFYRNEESTDGVDFEHDGRGTYIGAGWDFWFDSGGRMGPFVLAFHSSERDTDEVLVGLGATFYP